MKTQIVEHMEMTPLSVLSLFDTTKQQRQTFVQRCVDSITEGGRDPLQVHVQVKCLEEIVKGITSNSEYKAAVLNEAQKYGKAFELHNAKVQVKESGVSYDYSHTNDEVLFALMDEFDIMAQKIKERQKFLQTIPEGGMADPETGNIIYRAAKQSTTTVAVTLS